MVAMTYLKDIYHTSIKLGFDCFTCIYSTQVVVFFLVFWVFFSGCREILNSHLH